MQSQSQNPADQNHELASEIYDKIMGEIEPELMLSNVPLLDATYAGESKEEHEFRMKRYAVAYKKFEEAFGAFKTTVTGSIRQSKKQALQQQEQQSLSEDAQVLDAIVSKF